MTCHVWNRRIKGTLLFFVSFGQLQMMPEAVRQPVLTFTKLRPTAVAPMPWPPGNRLENLVRFSAYDVASWEDVLVQPKMMANLTTGLAFTLPEGSRLFTASRSGEWLPDGVDVLPREIESYEL